MGIFADLFTDMMAATVTVQTIVGRDTYGAPVYSSPNTYKARIVNKTQNVIGPNGQVVVAKGYAIIDTVDPFTVNDRVTLPDGSHPLLLDVNQESDETGPCYTRIDFQ